MCNYCAVEEEFTGELFTLESVIDGKAQNFEVYICDDPEEECFTLRVSGVHTDFAIRINFCPICGKKFYI